MNSRLSYFRNSITKINIYLLENEVFIFHPFLSRNIHPKISSISKRLFDDGFYSQAIFDTFKFLEKRIQEMVSVDETGFKLMMTVFSEDKALIKLTNLKSTSEIDEQKGFRFIFAGTTLAIRNPRGHEYKLNDDRDTCLDYLSFASLLIRRIEKAGYII